MPHRKHHELAAEISALDMLIDSLPGNDYLGRISLEARRTDLQARFARLGDRPNDGPPGGPVPPPKKPQ